MLITFTYNSIEFWIDDKTYKLASPDTSVKVYLNEQLNRRYVSYKDKAGKGRVAPFARLVCTAFHGPAPEGYQCGHLDDNALNDSPDNLKWMSRKENNSAPRKKLLNSLNAKHQSRAEQVIKATKGNDVQYFYNGRCAAAALGCSHVLVHKVLSPTDYAKSAKGWKLEYITFDQCLDEVCQMQNEEI